MFGTEQIEKAISWILTTGMLLSAVLVTVGGCLFLYSSASLPMTELANLTHFDYNQLKTLAIAAIAFDPQALIQAGVILLIGTQALRVGLLIIFYALIKDIRFCLISLFVFAVIVASFFKI